MTIDSIGTSYDTIEQLLERRQVILDKVNKYMISKDLGDRTESVITINKHNKYYLQVNIIKD